MSLAYEAPLHISAKLLNRGPYSLDSGGPLSEPPVIISTFSATDNSLEAPLPARQGPLMRSSTAAWWLLLSGSALGSLLDTDMARPEYRVPGLDPLLRCVGVDLGLTVLCVPHSSGRVRGLDTLLRRAGVDLLPLRDALPGFPIIMTVLCVDCLMG